MAGGGNSGPLFCVFAVIHDRALRIASSFETMHPVNLTRTLEFAGCVAGNGGPLMQALHTSTH